MGRWPSPAKLMKTSSCSATTLLEAPPSPLSSRPERSAVEGPAVLPPVLTLPLKRGLLSAFEDQNPILRHRQRRRLIGVEQDSLLLAKVVPVLSR